jgi:hypothetical protein
MMSAAGNFVPIEEGFAAIEVMESEGGERVPFLCIAQWRCGEWWSYDSGHRLLEYEGNSIVSIWPMTGDRKVEIKEEVNVWNPKEKYTNG